MASNTTAKSRRIMRYRAGTDQFDTLDPEGLGQGLIHTPAAEQYQKQHGFELVPDEEWDAALQDFHNRQQHSQHLAQQAAAKDTGPGMPPGRTPFFLGDNAVHGGGGQKPNPSLENALTWAAGASNMQSLLGPMSEADVSVGAPIVVSRTPAPAQKRPDVQVRPAGQVDSSVAERFLANARGGGAKPAPAALASVYAVDPVVGDYLAKQMGGLEEAQAQARDGRLAARLAHAGAMFNTAVSGARHEEDAYGDLERGADQPVVDYSQRRALAEKVEAEARDHAERLRKAGLDEREFQFKRDDAGRRDKLERDRLDQQERMRKDDREARSKDLAYRYAEMRQQRQFREQDKASEAEQKRADKMARESEKDIQELGKATTKAPYAEMQRALEDLDALAPGLPYGQAPKDLPISWGDRTLRQLPGGIGEGMMDPKAKKYAATITNLRDLVSRMRSGAVLNAGEEAHYLQLLGDKTFSDPEAAAAGINEIRRGIAQKLHNAQAPFATIRDEDGTSILDRYQGEGATSYRAPIFSGERSPTPVPTGRYKRGRDGRMYAEMSDGSAQEVR